MKPLSGFLLLILSFSSFAQTVSIKKVELAGEKIIVYYDLDDGNPNNDYLMHLYASKDNFAMPLTHVKGDVGIDIKPGVGKKIEWNIREEYGGYKGKLALEVRGKVYVPFIRLQGFNTGKGYKRGTSHTLNWKPGNSNPINIELYKGGQRISGDVNHPNNGAYTLYIPSSAKPGGDYRLKISDTKNTDDVIYTDLFKVTPKVPIWLKALPVVAVIGGVIIFTGGGGGENPPSGDSEIVDPPALPTGN